MAKLPAHGTAGFTAGTYLARSFRIEDIIIDPEISKVFTQDDKMRNEIAERIAKTGFDKSQPLTVWKGTNILLDGHTRLAAARESKLDEVPVVEMEFGTYEEAALYTFERQAVRRNLTSADILTAAQMLKGSKLKDGTGRAAELLAEKLHVSPSTIYQAQKIMREADEESIKAVQKGERSIKAVYNEIKGTKTIGPNIKTPEEDAEGRTPWLPENIKQLKSIIILLVESGEIKAARLVAAHCLTRREHQGFYKILPETIRSELE